MLLPSGNPFNCHKEVLFLHPIILIPKRFDFFPLDWGVLRRPGCVQISVRPSLVGLELELRHSCNSAFVV